MLAVVEQTLRSRSGVSVTALKCCVQYQSVRNYPRKPRWVPIAKTKMFKNIVVAPPPKLEHEEYTAIDNAYQLYSRSLWQYQMGISESQQLQMQKDAKQVSEEVELEKIMKLNDAENERIRIRREAALLEDWKLVEADILEQKREKEEQELRKWEETGKVLQSEMDRLKGVILPEHLDEAIEKALAAETDYNFAVTKDGKYLRGRHNNIEIDSGVYPPDPVLKPVEISK